MTTLTAKRQPRAFEICRGAKALLTLQNTEAATLSDPQRDNPYKSLTSRTVKRFGEIEENRCREFLRLRNFHVFNFAQLHTVG